MGSFSAPQYLPPQSWRQLIVLRGVLYKTQHFHPFMNSRIYKLLRLLAHKKVQVRRTSFCVPSWNYYCFVYAVCLTNLLHLLRKDLEIHYQARSFFVTDPDTLNCDTDVMFRAWFRGAPDSAELMAGLSLFQSEQFYDSMTDGISKPYKQQSQYRKYLITITETSTIALQALCSDILKDQLLGFSRRI